jgi:hypothetical protein
LPPPKPGQFPQGPKAKAEEAISSVIAATSPRAVLEFLISPISPFLVFDDHQFLIDHNSNTDWFRESRARKFIIFFPPKIRNGLKSPFLE